MMVPREDDERGKLNAKKKTIKVLERPMIDGHDRA
jgi:hypothetical protein